MRIAIVEDDTTQRKLLATMLADALTVVTLRGTPASSPPDIVEFGDALDILRLIDESVSSADAFPFDVIVADVFMPIQSGSIPHPHGGAVRIYDAIKKARLNDRVIMIIVTIDVLGAETDIRRIDEEQRSLDYQWAFLLSKPRTVSMSPTTYGISLEAWMSTVETVIAHREDQVFRAKGFLRLPPTELLSQPFFAGVKMEVDALIRPGSPPYLLITGERGTPKDAVAKYFAQRVDRAGPLATFALREGTEETLVAHIFGRELPEPREGYLELHAGETILINDYCLPSKHRGRIDKSVLGLLVSMEDRGQTSAQFYRMDGFQPKAFSGVLVLSCGAIDDLRKSGDIVERLVTLLQKRHVHVPSLRDVPDLIGSLASHFLSKTGNGRKLALDTMDAFRRYSWPGNVTELEDKIATLDRESKRDWITGEDLQRVGLSAFATQATIDLERSRGSSGGYTVLRWLFRLRRDLMHAPFMLRVISAIVGTLLLVSGLIQGINAWYDLRCKVRSAWCISISRPSHKPTVSGRAPSPDPTRH